MVLKRKRSKSVCETPKRQPSKSLSIPKNSKILNSLKLRSQMCLMKKESNCIDEFSHKVFISDKKQQINEDCILCGNKPCNNRLECAHAIH